MQPLPRFNVNNKCKKEDTDASKVNIKPLASSTMRIKNENKMLEPKLGFANLPEQMQRKAVKKGFNFTLMVIGESGLGKSTFVNSLLNQQIYEQKRDISSQMLLESTTKIDKHFIELDEKGVKLRLTIVDTPGFGDNLDCTECHKPIVEYIDEAYYQFFKDECAINRKNIVDNRVHCCLYFISPYGRSLKPLDLLVMKEIHNKVNIIPVIAKADTFTELELKKFKQMITDNLKEHKINFYQPPICGSDDEDEFRIQDAEIRESIPFSVIGSNTVVENENGRKCRGRQYPWGVVEVDNSKHCNFSILRTFILRTHMQDLKDVTNDILYENFRGDIIQMRMTRRNNDRCATLNSKTGSTASSIDDIVDTGNYLHEKEEEMHRLRSGVSNMNSQLSNGSGADLSAGSSLNGGSSGRYTASPSVKSSSLVAPIDSPVVSLKSSSTVASAAK